MKFVAKHEANMYKRTTLLVRSSFRTGKVVFAFYSVDVEKSLYMWFVATSVTMSERRTGEPVVIICDIRLRCCEEICVKIWRAETGGEDKGFAPKRR